MQIKLKKILRCCFQLRAALFSGLIFVLVLRLLHISLPKTRDKPLVRLCIYLGTLFKASLFWMALLAIGSACSDLLDFYACVAFKPSCGLQAECEAFKRACNSDSTDIIVDVHPHGSTVVDTASIPARQHQGRIFLSGPLLVFVHSVQGLCVYG